MNSLMSPTDLFAHVKDQLDVVRATREAAVDKWLSTPAVRASVEHYIQVTLVASVEHCLVKLIPQSAEGWCAVPVKTIAQQMHQTNENVSKSFSVKEIDYAIAKVAAEAGYPERELKQGWISANPFDSATVRPEPAEGAASAEPERE